MANEANGNFSGDSKHWVKSDVTWPENSFGIESKVTVFKACADEILGYDEV
jgi:hypothetical protein